MSAYGPAVVVSSVTHSNGRCQSMSVVASVKRGLLIQYIQSRPPAHVTQTAPRLLIRPLCWRLLNSHNQ